MNANVKALLFTVLGLGIGVGLTWTLRPRPAAPIPPAATPPKQMYQCPMHPQIILDHPGECPICGMALVPMEPASAGGEPGEGAALETHAVVAIDPERQQLIGLRTEKVTEGTVGGEVRAVGRVAVDETRVRKVNVKVEGFVEHLFVDFVGKPVAKGQPLFTVYSPELLAAQNEFLLALRTRKSLEGSAELQRSGEDLVASARRRLGLWDIPTSAIDALERTGQPTKTLTILSPAYGVVTAKNIAEGSRITPADIPFEITDLSRVWVLVDVYEAELGRAKAGMAADLKIQAFPGRSYKGRVVFVDPIMDPKTRTARLRLEFPNPAGDLKPEMFGEVVLKGPGHKGILLPLDAVLDAGTQKVVFVALGNGKFEPREVTTGTSMGEQIEILTGVQAGDEVVTRANFLVDSESRLKAALAHLGQKGGSKPEAAPSGHQH